jgi:MtN3 and saliva related transmembrane protein
MSHLNHLTRHKLNSKFNSINTIAYFVGLIAPLMTLPQLYTIWIQKNIQGVSIQTWFGFCIFNAFWVLYGTIHKDKPIIFSNLAWIGMQCLIVLGVLINK